MQILDIYITKFIVRAFAIIFIGLLAIFFITLTFELVDDIIQNNLPLTILIQYIFFKIPDLTCQTSPIALLLSTFLVIGNLQRGNEFLAMISSGISMYRTLVPFLIFGFIISILTFVISETYVPPSNQIAKYLRAKIKGKKIPKLETTENVWIKLGDKNILNVEYVNPTNNTLYGVSLYYLSSDFQIKSRIKAISAKYDKKMELWILKNGIEVKMQAGTQKITTFKTKRIKMDCTFSDIKIPERTPEEMSFSQLDAHIKKLARLGIDSNQLKVYLYAKISFPLANLILLIVGIPIALKNWFVGKSLNVAICILMAFFFWVTMSAGISLGRSGVFPPFFGAWLADIIFFALGIYMFADIKT